MMALALHMFSVSEHDVAPLEAETMTDERWAWVAMALVREIAGNARRLHDLLRLGRPRTSSGRPTGRSRTPWGRRRPRPEGLRLATGGARAGGCGDQMRGTVLLSDTDYPVSLRPIDLPPPFLLVAAWSAEDGLAWPSSGRAGARRTASDGGAAGG